MVGNFNLKLFVSVSGDENIRGGRNTAFTSEGLQQ